MEDRKKACLPSCLAADQSIISKRICSTLITTLTRYDDLRVAYRGAEKWQV